MPIGTKITWKTASTSNWIPDEHVKGSVGTMTIGGVKWTERNHGPLPVVRPNRHERRKAKAKGGG